MQLKVIYEPIAIQFFLISRLRYEQTIEAKGLDRFSYFDSYLEPRGRISDEVFPRIQNVRLAFANSRYLWHRHDIQLQIKGRVYAASEVDTALRLVGSRRDEKTSSV